MTNPKLTDHQVRILKDWHARFPSLGKYRARWLMRRVGPLLQGLLLERDSSGDSYRPIVHTHCLASGTDFISLALGRGLRSARNGAPDRVTVRSHDIRYIEAAAAMRHESPLAMDGPLPLRDVIAAYVVSAKAPHNGRCETSCKMRFSTAPGPATRGGQQR